ncbi:MAG TPA: hypothetical protein VHC71_06405 [Hyphomicrobium sp.]|jgi:capsular polysaccharide transport system ATP-binding protein|nr:hypothetical protein [Hyphomicrobium sp.]
MIILEQVTMNVAVHTRGATVYSKTRPVLSNVSLAIPSNRRIALFSAFESDKSIFNSLLCGLTAPRVGRVVKTVNVSFPVGYGGSFRPDLPVRKNVEHLARLYDLDSKDFAHFIGEVGRFGPAFNRPYSEMSAITQARFARIIGLSLPFDVYQLNDRCVVACKDKRDVLHQLFDERFQNAGMIISTANIKLALEYCNMALAMSEGELRLYDDVQEAFDSLRDATRTVRRRERRYLRRRTQQAPT